MSLRDTIVADLAHIASDLEDQTFTWNGEDYICIPSSQGAVASLEDGGFSVDADLVLNVQKDLFTDGVYPKSQQKVVFSSKNYRIITIRNDATTAFLRLICADDSRGI